MIDKVALIDWDKIVYYDESSPSCLRWKVYRASCAQIGMAAGGLQQNSYYYVKYKDVLYKAHRVVWFLNHKNIDKGLFIDHINGNRSDNRIENLQLVPRWKNAQNIKKTASNSSGVTGVGLYKSGTKEHYYWQAYWRCFIDHKLKTKSFSVLKYGYDNAFELAVAYREKMILEQNALGAEYSDRHGK